MSVHITQRSYKLTGEPASFIYRVLDEFHPFARRAAYHHGVLVDGHEAKNLAQLGGRGREFDELVADGEFVTRLLTGNDCILQVDVMYKESTDPNKVDYDRRTFVFKAPEWARLPPTEQNTIRAKPFYLKCELDRHGYRTSWTEGEAGTEFSVGGKAGNFASAFITIDNRLLYSCDRPETDEEINALRLAEDFGFSVDMPPEKMDLPATPDVDMRRTVALMRQSVEYHQD